jgi:DNA-binding NtrC family response regulator
MNRSAENKVESSRGAAVLLVEEDRGYLEFLRTVIQGTGHKVHACDSYSEGICQLQSGAYDIVVVGQGSPSFEGWCVLGSAATFDRRLPVVVVARHAEMRCYLEAMQSGAVDYLAEPFVGADMSRVMQKYARHRSMNGPRPSAAAIPLAHAA